MAKRKEPTIREVYGTLNEFFKFTKNQFERADAQFESMGKRFELVDSQLKILIKSFYTTGMEVMIG